MMCWRERPRSFGPSPIGLQTLLAITTRSRLPRAFIQRPSTFSDSPRLYESDVSTKLPPASTKASRTASDCAWSVMRPNVLPPRQKAVTLSPVRPRLRVSIDPPPVRADPITTAGSARAPERSDRIRAARGALSLPREEGPDAERQTGLRPDRHVRDRRGGRRVPPRRGDLLPGPPLPPTRGRAVPDVARRARRRLVGRDARE